MEDICFLCGNEAGATMENYGVKQRVCAQCSANLAHIIYKAKKIPIMIKVKCKYKAVIWNNQLRELSPQEITQLENMKMF